MLMGFRANRVEMRDGRIAAVIAEDTRTARRVRVGATLFADCTGDASIGLQAGEDSEVADAGKMGASNLWSIMNTASPTEVPKCECKDKEALSISLREGRAVAPFPRCPWDALKNVDGLYPNHRLGWVAFIAGKRESRRLLGDIVLKGAIVIR